MTAAPELHVALIGFGEVGQTLAADLSAAGQTDVIAWDRLFRVSDSAPRRAAGRLAHLRAARDMAEALSDPAIAAPSATTRVVISAVTAAECVAAAREAASSLQPDTYYLDVNSVSPATRTEAASLIETAGGRYVEAAIMSPIEPKGINSPILLGGPRARAFLPTARALGFHGVEVFADRIGAASAAKMCRSVVIKGMESLLAESLLAARFYGVEETILASLNLQFPATDWPVVARYMLSRSLQHGRRRAEEMHEVARTVAEAGIDPHMSRACAERQNWAAAHADALQYERLTDLLDGLLGRGETSE